MSSLICKLCLGQIKNKCVSGEESKIGIYIFLIFSGKIKFYAFWKAFCLLKCIELYFFQKTLKILGFTSKFR